MSVQSRFCSNVDEKLSRNCRSSKESKDLDLLIIMANPKQAVRDVILWMLSNPGRKILLLDLWANYPKMSIQSRG